MVAFVHASVTAVDMLERWESTVGQVTEREAALDHLEGYVRWLGAQRLGSVFQASYDRGGLLVARKISDHPPSPRKSPIPE